MPIYEYECPKCGNKFEKRRGFNDSDMEIKCPKCGKENPRRIISACAVSSSGSSSGSSAAASSCGSGGFS